ncbi:Z-ring formation inhibitor MciZ [Neobacillus sp. D3-1R]
MKVYVHEKGIIFVGKAWEIKQKLLEYQKQYTLLKDWLNEASIKKES